MTPFTWKTNHRLHHCCWQWCLNDPSLDMINIAYHNARPETQINRSNLMASVLLTLGSIDQVIIWETLTPGKLPSLSLYLKHQSLKFSVSKVSLNLPNLVRGEAWNMIWQMYRNQSTLNLARKVQVLLIDWNSSHRNGYRHQCVSWGRPRTVCKLTIVVHLMYITVTFNLCTSLGLQTQFAIFSGARQRNNRA